MTPVVILHGFTGAPASLGSLSSDAICPRLAGHAGQSTSDSFDAEVERLRALLPGGCHLVGYSLGARLALAIAVREPRRLRSLTLFSGRPGIADPTERSLRRDADARLADDLESRGLEWFVDHWQDRPMWQSQRRLESRVLAAQREIRMSHAVAGLAGSLRAQGVGVMPDLWPRLANLQVPTTIVAGQLDPAYCRLARQMAELIVGARLLIAPDAGHNVILEQPEWAAAMVPT